MNLASAVFATLSTLLVLGCSGTTINATAINPAHRPMGARPPASVELFTSGAPARSHVDIAFLEAEQASSFSTDGTPAMLAKLRIRGAQMGCDALVIGGLSSRDPGVTDAETWINDQPRGRKGVFATCIVYTYEPQAVATAPAASAGGGAAVVE